MSTLPNLAGVATPDLVEHIGASNFKASYINWSRTMQLLRKHASDWMPEVLPAPDGSILHRAPVGGFLLIRFRNLTAPVTFDAVTPAVPQAVMDSRNAAIPFDKITARDISDTHRRGVCMAAAFTFGLAYELWAKIDLESGYSTDAPDNVATLKVKPTDGAWEGQCEESQAFLRKIAEQVSALIMSGDLEAAVDYLESQQLDAEEKIAIWTLFDSKERSAMKRTQAKRKAA